MNTSSKTEFTKYLTKELQPALDDIETLEPANRKHVQKLVYTNLVDRFDYLVDRFVLDNCREGALVERAFKNSDDPVTERDLIGLLMREQDLQSALDSRIQDKLRLSVLRERHSKKFATLLSLIEGLDDVLKKPRVNPSTGEILGTMKMQIKTTPHSICGYADWLYSRRNGIVHGAGGSKFLDNDVKQIKSIYGIQITKTYKISLPSVRIATRFYKDVCALLH